MLGKDDMSHIHPQLITHFQCMKCKGYFIGNTMCDETREPRPVSYIVPSNWEWETVVALCVRCNKKLHEWLGNS